MEERKTVVEYVNPQGKQHSTAGVVGAALGGTGLGVALLNTLGNSAGNLVRNYLGGNNPAVIAPAQAPVVVAPAAASALEVVAPMLASVLTGVASHTGGHRNDCGGSVSKYELGLIREMSAKDSEIGQLKAEKYADSAVQNAVEKIMVKYDTALAVANNKICNLETHAAVTATGFEDYKQFANRLFVHQPTAKINGCVVTTTNACCCPCPSTGGSPE